MDMLPQSVGMMAQAAHWDCFGCRWGRGAHWPLLATIGTGRFRNAQSSMKRSIKKKAQRAEKSGRHWQGYGWQEPALAGSSAHGHGWQESGWQEPALAGPSASSASSSWTGVTLTEAPTRLWLTPGPRGTSRLLRPMGGRTTRGLLEKVAESFFHSTCAGGSVKGDCTLFLVSTGQMTRAANAKEKNMCT